MGTAWKGDTQPYPQPRIRLRNIATGRTVARTIGDGRAGSSSSASEPTLMSSNWCLATTGSWRWDDLFGVPPGGQATTVVRLSSKTPWVAGSSPMRPRRQSARHRAIGVTASGSGECAVALNLAFHVRRPGSSADRRGHRVLLESAPVVEWTAGSPADRLTAVFRHRRISAAAFVIVVAG